MPDLFISFISLIVFSSSPNSNKTFFSIIHGNRLRNGVYLRIDLQKTCWCNPNGDRYGGKVISIIPL